MKSNGFETVIAKYNVEPTSDLICSYYRETDITTRKTVLRTLIPVLSSLFTSRELVLITILKDSILFTPIASKSLTKRMFWNEIVDYEFFSDHTRGITIPLVYAIKKKMLDGKDIFIEKHTRFEDSKGPDASFAITYAKVNELTKHLKRIEKVEFGK